MAFDVRTATLVSGCITGVLALEMFFFSIARKENQPFIWASLGCALFFGGLILFAFSGLIPDFFSIVVARVIGSASMVAFYELFRRLLEASPKKIIIALAALAVEFILFVWFTYFQPDFQARVLVVRWFYLFLSGCSIKLLLSNAPKGRQLLYIVIAAPFLVSFIATAIRIGIIMSGAWMGIEEYNDPGHGVALVNIGVVAVWVSLSAVLMVDDRLRQHIELLAMSDPLTGALNRKALTEAAYREIHRAQRNQTPLSLIITDLDHFKKVNDTYGHQAGDAVLVQTVALYKGILRGEDLLARYGGEEFVVLLPGADIAKAAAVAERLRQASRDERLAFNEKTISVSSSFGVASYDGNSAGFEDVVTRADEALYQAKRQGRDRVVVYGQDAKGIAPTNSR